MDGMSMSCSHTNKRDRLKNKVGQSLKVALTSVCYRYTCTQRHIIDILTYTHHNLPSPQSK